MANSQDSRWMRLALAEAARGQGLVEPNPMVGAVITRHNQVIGIGHHSAYGGDHAEVAALKHCSETPSGATIHVTLEPCSHFGKTPPCVDAILKAGLRRVVVATHDPFPDVNGNGIRRLQEAGIVVETWPETSGIALDSARLNLPFFKKVKTGRPFVIAKWAMSLDGRIALPSGDSRWISNPKSRSIVHQTRGRVDAIIVGIGAAIADNPSLTARPPGPRTPVRVVIDPNAELPLDHHLVQSSNLYPTWLFCSHSASRTRFQNLRDHGCQLFEIEPDPSGTISPNKVLDQLGSAGMTNVLLEGGSRLLGRFFDDQAIDEVQVFIAPVLFGGPASFPPIQGRQTLPMEMVTRLSHIKRTQIDDDTLITGLLRQPWIDFPL